MLPPISYGSHLCEMAIYTAKMSLILVRALTVMLLFFSPTQTPKTIFDASPDMHSAMVPQLVVPVDVSGKLVYTADSMSLEHPSIPPSPKTFEKWRGQLPSAEQHLLRVIT
jgi:hypothetical protein